VFDETPQSGWRSGKAACRQRDVAAVDQQKRRQGLGPPRMAKRPGFSSTSMSNAHALACGRSRRRHGGVTRGYKVKIRRRTTGRARNVGSGTCRRKARLDGRHTSVGGHAVAAVRFSQSRAHHHGQGPILSPRHKTGIQSGMRSTVLTWGSWSRVVATPGGGEAGRCRNSGGARTRHDKGKQCRVSRFIRSSGPAP
jgi:hypothetical protein